MDKKVLKTKELSEELKKTNNHKEILIKIAKYLLILYITYLFIAPGYLGTVIVLQLAMQSNLLWIKIYSALFMVIMLIWAIVSYLNNKNLFYIEYITIIGIANLVIAYNYTHFPILELIKKVLYPFA